MTKLQQFQEDRNFRVLALLEKNSNVSQRDLASRLGISLGAVNYALRALMDKGMVKAQNFSKSDRKLAYSYNLTPQGLAEKVSLTSHFLKRKIDEYEALKSEIEGLQGLLVNENSLNGSQFKSPELDVNK